MIARILATLSAVAMAACFTFSAPATTAATGTTSADATAMNMWYGGPLPHSRGGVTQWPTQGTSGAQTSTIATTDQSTGIVLIDTEVDFGTAQAAGTGMVIGADGIVVTNHHVVASSTSVTVTVPVTGQTYTADVLGYDATTDVAVLQLEGASDLTTITTDASQVAVSDSITAVGNAQGGGRLIAAPGQITAVGQDITVTEDDGSTAALTDLIAMSAALVPGDSGGAVLNSHGDVVAMNVAGSTGGRSTVGYAIPIDAVMTVADHVLAGTVTDTVALGRTAAIGVQVSTHAQGVNIVGVISGGPADEAGITPGSVITSIGSTTLASVADLTTILASHQPGDRVEVAWTDRGGATHDAWVTLTQAPLA
ncbi:MAG: S1C family serine protease [Propionibacteriaceae bacterium]|nr:S1C family serine protease [Propionibacteriaceae bacterium]